MKIHRFYILFRFLLTFIASGSETPIIYCDDDQITFYKIAQYPAIFNKTTTKYQIQQSVNFLEIIYILDIQEYNNQYNLIHLQDIEGDIVKVYQNQNAFFIERIKLQLQYQNLDFYNLSNSILFQKFFQLPQCEKFIYCQQKQSLFLVICEEEDQYLIYILDFDNFSQIIKVINQNKIDDCTLNIIFDSHEQKIYLSFQNCQNWIIYVIDFLDINVWIQNDNFIQTGILRCFTFQDDQFFFVFDHQIFQMIKQEYFLVYQNSNMKILTFSRQYEMNIIILEEEDQNGEIFEIPNIVTIIITRKEMPKQILQVNNKIILRYETYLEHLETKNVRFRLLQKIDKLFLLHLNDIFIFGINFTQIIVIKSNQYSPFLNCSQFKYGDNISLITSELKYDSQLTFVNIGRDDLDLFESIQKISFKENFQKKEFLLTFDKKQIRKFGSIPNITPLDNDKLHCNLKEYIITCIYQNVASTNWFYIIKLVDGQQGILYQQQQKIYFQECMSKKLTFLGKFETVEQNNVYLYQDIILIQFKQKPRILALKVLTSIEYRLLEFQDEILDVQFYDFQIIIILETCKIFQIQSDLKLHMLKMKNYFVSQQSCKNMHYQNEQFSFYYNETTLIIFESFLTSTIQLSNYQINNIKKIQKTNNFYLIEEKRQSQIILSMQVYFQQQFIKLYDFPKQNFQYMNPLIFIMNSKFLVVAAESIDSINSSQVLLIYSLQTKQKNNLIYVIEVDQFTFQFVENDRLVYFFQNQIHLYSIGEIVFTCSTELFFQFRKSFNLPIQVVSRKNIIQTKILSINVSLINSIETLIPYNTTKIKLEQQDANEIIYLDPRKYFMGPLRKIISQSNSIINPIQIIQKIDFTECTHFQNSICMNFQENFIILNIMENKKKIYVSQIDNITCYFQNDLYILLDDQQSMIKFKLYNAESELIQSQSLEYYCNSQKYSHVVDDLLIFSCNNLMSLYIMSKNSIFLLGQVEIFADHYSILKVKNKKNSFFLHEFQIKAEFIQFISIEESQIISKTLSLINNFDIYLSLIYILEVEYFQEGANNQKQIQIKFLVQYANRFGYLYSAGLDINQNKFELIQQLGIIRYSEGIQPTKVVMLQPDILLVIKIVKYPQYDLTVYNISKIEEFNFLDEIYSQSYNRFTIQIFNQSIAFLTQQNQHLVLKFSSYELNLSTLDSFSNITLKFENKISNLDFVADIQINCKSKQINVVMLLIYLNEIIILAWILGSKIQKRKRKRLIISFEKQFEQIQDLNLQNQYM